jgi:hypothetical protein
MAPVKYEKVSQGQNDEFEGFFDNLSNLFPLLFPIFQHSNIPLFHYSAFDIQSKRIFEKKIL